MKMVLVPLDFSDETPRVVEEAAKLAKAVNGHVLLLDVARVPQAMPHHASELANLAQASIVIEAAAGRQLADIEEDLNSTVMEARAA